MSEKKGFFARLRQGMSKSREQIAAVTEDALQADAPIDEDLYDALLDAMILSDMGAACAEEALEKLRETVKTQKLRTAGQAKTALKEILVGMLEVEKPILKWPMVILMVGVNGVGKTTTIGKLALRFQGLGRTIILCAADTFRAAAADQLQTLGDEQGVRVFRGDGKHPVEIAKGAVQDAIDNMRDVVIVDTAGRLHVDQDMMDEAVAIRDAVKPDQIFMVVDAMTGQDVVNVVSEFARQVDFDGVIMTKMDGDARGGGALSIREVTGKPIVFISAGEKADTLEVFHPDRMAKRILGMGDVVSVIERAIEVQDKEIEKAEAERLARAQFDFNDFLDIIKQTRKMGGLGSLVSALPGGNKALADGNVDEGELDRIEAIINSMTPEERSKPNMLNGSRRARIARGSGMSVTQVNQLIKRFNETRKQVKKVMTAFNAQSKGKKGKRRRKMRIPGMGNIDFSKFEDMK